MARKKAKYTTGRKPTRREAVYRKRLLSRKVKTKKVRVITRKEQPSLLRGETVSVRGPKGQVLIVPMQEVRALKKREMGGPVSSSWIAMIEWNPNGYAYFETLQGFRYNVFIPFDMFEEWFYAHSKGTYFNYMIKDKFKVERA